MTVALSNRTTELLAACFVDEDQRRRLSARLESETGAEAEAELVDRIRYSIIRLIVENPDKGYDEVAFELARVDWRDLLVAAGHGDWGAHNTWAASALREPPQQLLVEPDPVPIKADERGWATCPNCKKRFKFSDKAVFDGKWHKTCRQRLVFVGDGSEHNR